MDIAHKTCLILHLLAPRPKLISRWHKKLTHSSNAINSGLDKNINQSYDAYISCKIHAIMLITPGCSYQSQELKFHINYEFNSPKMLDVTE